MSAMSSRSRLCALLLAGSLALTACGGGDGADDGADDEAGSGDASSSGAAPSPTFTQTVDPNEAYHLDLPPDVQLTTLGSDLKVGDTARVAWEPDKNTVGVLAITVTRLRKGTLDDFAGFTLDDRTKESTPYYVEARVKNIGRSDLSGVGVPLYLVDGHDTLVGASSFQSTFKPCAAKPLPEKFTRDKSTKVCLVFVAGNHGFLKAVSFRPTQEYAPIEWTGTVVKPTKKPTKNS